MLSCFKRSIYEAVWIQFLPNLGVSAQIPENNLHIGEGSVPLLGVAGNAI